MKKWILTALFSVLVVQPVIGENKVPYTCQKKCFNECKLKNQAVKNCKLSNFTSVSFKISCECRDLQPGEVLPMYFHNTRIIPTSAS
jgi:hypothetical protein